ncbi:rod shape-determining protein [Nonomuraea sp. NPDC050783]|uniref:rod shape-determining protein n=1 Tax=Nonomuraea sp. NPDC050783 TaxID=3154634 RepID=UPI003467B8EE
MSLLGVDLGAARTRIYARRRGIVLDEPSAVVRDARTGRIVSYGAETGDDGHETCRPVSGGLPADDELTRLLVRHFLRRVHRRPFARPRLVMAVPEHATAIDRAALREVAYEAEARGLLLVPHGLAAALGAGVPVGDGAGWMVIDIGRDAARVAVLSHGAVVAAGTVPVGGRALTLAVARLVEREHGLLLDEDEVEAVKREHGPPDRQVLVRGRDAETGRERAASLPVRLVREATRQPVETIAQAAVDTVERCPPELVADLGERGAVLVGGGALLRGLDRWLRVALRMPVRRAERPVESVALGLGRCVEDQDLVNRLKAVAP